MAELLRSIDRWYRTVVLHDDTWYDKIVFDHPALDGKLEAVEQALRHPDVVTFDVDVPGGENFYRRGLLSPPNDTAYLKVCVRFRKSEAEESGVIVTAYPTYRIKRGERVRWR